MIASPPVNGATNGVLPPDPASHVIAEPLYTSMPMAGAPTLANLVISVASAADTITQWGINPRQRDLELRAFWPTEYMFSGALFTAVAQYVAFGWTLTGPPKTTKLAQAVLNNVQLGQGWEALMTPFLIDYFTQDNGAFMEIVRTDDEPNAPVVSLNHLDSYRCIRTGKHETPVLYFDLYGKSHLLKWYNVIAMSEFPSPVEEARGIGYCALTRVLRYAQTFRDISIVKQEKAGGRFTRQVHMVGGVSKRVIEDAVVQKQAEADSQGLLRYITPLIVASLDPTARVTKETIDLASVPDDWDDEKSQRSYVLALSMAFGTDYQNFAPLPGGGLGSASQSKVLNMKSRGKGPGLFMNKISHQFNYHGVLPKSVRFSFGEQDAAEQMEQIEVQKSRGEWLETLIRAGAVTTEVARQILVDVGDLDERYLIMMREQNATQEITASSNDPIEEYDKTDVKPGEPGPKEPPKSSAPTGAGNAMSPDGAVPRPANSNASRPRNPATNNRRNPGGTPRAGTRA